ncbi:hypothetical protein LEP3755_13620 [Leptolyngbya sp. NIES-3755]|nr:hypothetical protein LEP3755_13620 [Leptolyngbya sp. NIES-3755]
MISDAEITSMKRELAPLIGLRIDWLSLPETALSGFEPSQIAVIINTLADAVLPQIELLAETEENREKLQRLGLSKAPSQIGNRESYPDYIHRSGYRLELKGLFVDTPSLGLKRPPTRREPSARLKENVKLSNIIPDKDFLMLAAIQLQRFSTVCKPVIIDIGLFPMDHCIEARDRRLIASGGRWREGIPQVVKKTSQTKYRRGEVLSDSDYQKDTNFGKLKRIPYEPLQRFMLRHGIVASLDEEQLDLE